MKEHNITLRIYDVHTKLNVADNISRRKAVSRKLAFATTEIFLDHAESRPTDLERATMRPSVYLTDMGFAKS